MDILQQKQARILLKLKTQIINVRNNSKSKYENLMCPKCKKEIAFPLISTPGAY